MTAQVACPMCGSSISDGKLRCPACGEALPQRPALAVDQGQQVFNLVAIVGGSAMILAFLMVAAIVAVLIVLFFLMWHV